MALTVCVYIGICNKGDRGRSVDDGINGVVCICTTVMIMVINIYLLVIYKEKVENICQNKYVSPFVHKPC